MVPVCFVPAGFVCLVALRKLCVRGSVAVALIDLTGWSRETVLGVAENAVSRGHAKNNKITLENAVSSDGKAIYSARLQQQ